MKNLIFATLVLGASMTALTAMAADVKVAEFTIADRPALEKAINKASSLSGQTLIGAMGVALLNDEETQKELQPFLGKKQTVVCDEESLKDIFDADINISETEDSDLEDGCVAKLSIFEIGKILDTGNSDDDAELGKDCVAAMADDLLSDIERVDISLWVSDAGVDLRLALAFGGDSAEFLSEVIPLGANPMSNIPENSLFSIAYSTKCDIAGRIAKAIDVLRSNIPELGFIDCKVRGGIADMQVDVENIPEEELEEEEFCAAAVKALEAAHAVKNLSAPRPQGFSFGVHGIEGSAGAADIFSEEDISRCDVFAKFSICRIFKAIASCPQVRSEFGKDELMALNMFMSQVLSLDGADIGVMVWREGSCLNCTVRANPAEVKSLSMAAAALIPVATSGSSSLEDMFAEFLGASAPARRRDRGSRLMQQR